MITINLYSVLFLVFLGLIWILEVWLARRQFRHVRLHRAQVPPLFQDHIPLAAHQKAADYTVAKLQLGVISNGLGVAIVLLWTLGGGLAWLDSLWRELGWNDLGTGIAVLLSFVFIGTLLDLPVRIYRTFVLEQNFGFNRTTGWLFFQDFLKQGALMFLLGIPLAAGALWLMEHAGSYWWLYLWLSWLSLIFLMMWAYPAFIAPWFNTFTPLTDESLRQRVEGLLARCGFKSQGIFVMDGSRRSGHGNAYFTGLGNNKRIVFFDTLLESLNSEQIEAVLAHELGHFKRRHIFKNLIMMALLSFAGLALLGWLSAQPAFYQGLGVGYPSHYMALALFMLVAPVLTFFLHPFLTYLSRRYEFEADEFAVKMTNGQALAQALVKLYKENAGTLTPDPIHSAVYDSHPPAPVRLAHLQAQGAR
ncbi:Ste24 endopeptidase [Nitrosococcus oceani ATCC 19707]|uniref:Ste24 endopeptidase n=2 Tax=Nitrosococcus oceani TaxID=1229 RepID=Q3JE78_NITOC|nr:M48 family metallopeptidase [Nitrosococcus oceani]ABA56868.1 Ste24 endopeptidase [Nitrosococcus oceani ATCC 19707]EDZ65679.1 peptidase, M48 family [Nitrosococcus oceani AFC27]KFI20710.1 peptidase M48 [Nitrosococcus oceani C-27]GEM21701.1 peptidase M48 [Nitrosococcus oceani]